MQLQVRAGDDHRAAGVVDALAEQVLAEAALLALEHVGERLQRPVARAGDRAAAAAVVEQRVDGLLQHPLLVVDDDLGRAEVEQPLEAVVPVDHAPVEVVQVARGEAAAVELHHRAQLRRDHRHGLEDHPLGLVLRGDERRDDLQPLDRALLLLALRGLDRLAERARLLGQVEVAEQVADRLRPHAAAEVDAEAVRAAEAVLELAEDLLVVDDELRLELAEELPRLLEPAHRVDRRLAGVLAPRLDVGVHLAHLQHPLADRVEVVLARALLQAEVVRELAHVLGGCARVGLRDHVGEQALADLARLLQVLHVDAGDELGVVALELGAREQRVDDLVDVLRQRALLRAGRGLELGAQRRERLLDLLRRGRDLLVLARGELAVGARRGGPDELADLLRVLGRDGAGELREDPGRERAHLLERRQPCLLGPVRETAGPEVVVLVEALVLALGEVVAAPLEPLLERGERLVAVDVDLLGLGLDLVLEVVQVLGARLDVDRGHDRGGEVEHLLELARGDVEQVADPARDALEEPDVADRSGEVDVTHALAAHLLARHLDAAALADDALVADALVLAAVALPVLGRTEDALAEQAVALRLQGAVVDGLRLGDLARGPVADLLAGSKPDADRVEIVDVDQVISASFFSAVGSVLVFGVSRRARGRRPLRRAGRPAPAPPPRPPRRG